MTMNQPLEALLRPPIEWLISGAVITISLLLLKFGFLLPLTRIEARIIVIGLMLLGCHRFLQGYKIYRYQHNLKKMPHYSLTLKNIPVSNKKLFLGKGFLWTTKHTQRLRDLDLCYNLHYKLLPKIKLKKYPEIGGEPCIHGVCDHEANIKMNLIERASHVLVMGLPGVGKTRFAEILINQDIRRGDVVIVLDPKGDIGLLKSMVEAAKLANREKDLLVFHLGFPEASCRYNPIGAFTRITEVANRISNQLPSSGEAQAFKEFGWQFMNSIAMALVAMNEIPTYEKMNFYISKMDVLLEKYLDHWLGSLNPDYQYWVRDYLHNNKKDKKEIPRLKGLIAYVEEHQLIHNPVFDDLNNACRYDREYFSKITASLGPLLKKLTTGKVTEILSPKLDDTNDKRPLLNWLEVISQNKIVYVGLDALSDPVVAAAVGNAMFSDLVSVAGRLYKFGLDKDIKTGSPRPSAARPRDDGVRICLHSDEFNEIIGDEFIPLLNKSRGAGFTVTAYTQTWSDVEARLKSHAKAGQVAGNFGTVVMFRCKEAATVDMFLNQLPVVPIIRVTPSSSVHDKAFVRDNIHYESSNHDQLAHVEHRLIEQNDVLNLPKGQAFCLLEGGKLYKLRVPLPKENKVSNQDTKELIQSINCK